MSKSNKPNTSARQAPSLSNRRVGIVAAILGLCFLIIGTYSLQNQEESVEASIADSSQEINAPLVQEDQFAEEAIEESQDFAASQEEFAPDVLEESTSSNSSADFEEAEVNRESRAKPRISTAPTPKPMQVQSAVKWAGLNAAIEANNLQVNWQTGMEANTDYFEIERSLDDENFESIGQVKGQGMGSFNDVNYSFSDEQLRFVGMPRVYYRIKQVGHDKKVSYSDVYEHDLGLDLGLYLKVQDIKDGFLTLVYSGDEAGEAMVSIITPGGDLVYEEKLEVGFTPRKRKMNASILGQGVYLLVLQNDKTRVSEMLEIGG